MPNDAEQYWDAYEDDPTRYHDHDQLPDDDDESFEVRTVDTDSLMQPRAPQPADARFPAIPVGTGDAASNDDDDDDDDGFIAFTVDPPAAAEAKRPGVTSSTAPVAPLASSSSAVQPRPQARSPLRVQARPQTHTRARRERRASRPPSTWWSTLRMFVTVLAAAVLVSTIFSLWTKPTFFTDEFRAGLERVQATQHEIYLQPSPLPTEVRTVRIGIIAGHTGPPLQDDLPEDPGAVCADGLTERRINEAVAREVVAALRREQYTVDLLEEFDPQLDGYQADVLVSIHTNDCQDYGPAGTGYNVASASSRQSTRGQDERLLSCLISQYGATTGLPNHQALTYDMTDYHTFSEVAVDTPTSIIEIGFMLNDRPVLLNQQPLIAQGIVNGIRCFLRPELYGEG